VSLTSQCRGPSTQLLRRKQDHGHQAPYQQQNEGVFLDVHRCVQRRLCLGPAFYLFRQGCWSPSTLNGGYSAKLDHEVFEIAQRDPRIGIIEDNALDDLFDSNEEEHIKADLQDEVDEKRAAETS